MFFLFITLLINTVLLHGASTGPMNNTTLFKLIYEKNSWLNKNTRSGNGSDLPETPIIRMRLPELLKKYEVQTVLDAGCGEFYWQKEIDLSFLTLYIGIDIVPAIIEQNTQKYGSAQRVFYHMNMIEADIPQVDVIICRDVLQHLSDIDIMRILNNFKISGSTYLLASTFRNKQRNEDPATQKDALQWRVTGKGRNMQLEPFNFPEPIEVIVEGFENKTLGLWHIADLPSYNIANEKEQALHAQRLSLLEE